MKREILFLFTIFLISTATPGRGFAQTTVFQESFDAVVEPDLPATALSFDDSWSTSSSSESTGSGGNNLRHGGTTPGDVVFGPIDLQNASSVTLSYLARRTSSYPADSLAVAVSSDDGASWTTLMGPGTALPETTSEYVVVSTPIPDSLAAGTEIRLRFRGFGGTSSGSNIRIDDLSVTATVDLSGVTDTFGFGQASSTSSGQAVSLPLDLAWTGSDSIQGIQFDVTFDASLLDMTGVAAGSAIAGPDWTVDFSTGSGSARVIILGGGGAFISTGVYAGLLSLDFLPTAGGGTSDTLTTVSIGDLIVSAYDAGGSDLAVVASPGQHELTIEYGDASILVSADSVSLGSAVVGASTSGVLTVSNPTGDGDLIVSDVTSSSALFTVSPTTVTIPPGGSRDLDITYTPGHTEFGFSSAVLSLEHNAPDGITPVQVTATGTGGRGDATFDGYVDIGDVVVGIDAALDRIEPATVAATIDLHPFPTGDGGVDVRDLTVLVHAILNGAWPDAVTLPALPAPDGAAGKDSPSAIVLSGDRTSGTILGVQTGSGLRGLQLVLRGVDNEPEVLMPEASAPSGADDVGASSFTRSAFDPTTGRFTLLAASSGIVLGEADRLVIRGLPADFEPGDVTLSIGITSESERLDLAVADRRETSTETPGSSGLGLSVFPNPTRAGIPATIRIARQTSRTDASSSSWNVRIVDLLGREILSRRIVSNGNDFEIDTSLLPPGIYLVRAGAGETIRTVPLTVTR